MNRTEIFRKGDSVIYVENKPFNSIFSKPKKVRKSRTAIRITKSKVEETIDVVRTFNPSLSINEVSQRVMEVIEKQFQLKGETLSYKREQTIMRIISNYFRK